MWFVWVREALVALASACEISSNKYISLAETKNASVVSEVMRKENISFAEKRFHLLPKAISGRSLSDEERDIFKDIEKTYRARNKVMHEGRAYFIENNIEISVDIPIAAGFIESVKEGVNWISSLSV